MKWRWTDRVAFICFGGAVLALIGFHALPIHYLQETATEWSRTRGWEVWEQVLDWFKRPTSIDPDQLEAVIWASLFASMVVFPVSLVLVRWMATHRILWWLVLTLSIGLIAGLTAPLGWMLVEDHGEPYHRYGLGWYCLVLAPVFQFAGMLFVRWLPLAQDDSD